MSVGIEFSGSLVVGLPYSNASSGGAVVACGILLTYIKVHPIKNIKILTSPFNLSMYVAIIEACSVNRIIFSSFIFNSFLRARSCVSIGMSATNPSYTI